MHDYVTLKIFFSRWICLWAKSQYRLLLSTSEARLVCHELRECFRFVSCGAPQTSTSKQQSVSVSTAQHTSQSYFHSRIKLEILVFSFQERTSNACWAASTSCYNNNIYRVSQTSLLLLFFLMFICGKFQNIAYHYCHISHLFMFDLLRSFHKCHILRGPNHSLFGSFSTSSIFQTVSSTARTSLLLSE